MKAFISAVLIGIGIEAALVAALIGGGLGPCGPASSVSAFVLWLHTPGFLLVRAIHIPELIGVWVVAALYTAIWSVGSLLVLRGRS